MKKLLGPAEPVKVIGARVVDNDELVSRYVERWLGVQAVHLRRQLSRCESPAETILVASLLTGEDPHGLVFHVSEEAGSRWDGEPSGPVGYAKEDRITLDCGVTLKLRGGGHFRANVTLETNDLKVAVVIVNESTTTNRSRANIEKSIRGARWTPVLLDESVVLRSADACATKLGDMFWLLLDVGPLPIRGA